MKKLLCSFALITTLFACSSDDDNQAQTVEKGIVKIEITTENIDNNFEESLTLQVVGDNMSQTNVLGAEWEEVQEPHNTTKWFYVQHNLPTTKIYETTKEVTSVTYSSLIFPKTTTSNSTTGTLKFYLNGVLKKTETFVASSTTMTQVTIPFVVTN